MPKGLFEPGSGFAPTLASRTSLTPQDESLFRSFQSNLLSLISHELRTPLMGILNSVGLLDDEGSAGDAVGAGIPKEELVKMARQNAQRLQRTLTTLLDMASLESHTFHAHLREIELVRMIRNRIELNDSIYRDHEVKVEYEGPEECIALADPQKFARAVDLCLENLAFRVKKGTNLNVRISSGATPSVHFEFELREGFEEAWDGAWKHGEAGTAGGARAPASAFAGVMQTEEAFLTRTEEGLGSEFLLIHEIMRLHRGRFTQKRKKAQVALALEFPALTPEELLKTVLTSRAFVVSNQTASVGLVLVKVPKGREIEGFRAELKGLLYRTTDSAYALPKRGEVAIVMDDYRRDDLPKLITRMQNSLTLKLTYSTAHCPEDVADPSELFEFAKGRG